MRKLINVVALILVLTCSTYAGEMQNGQPVPPTTPPQQSSEELTPQGDMHYPLIQIVMNLLGLL